MDFTELPAALTAAAARVASLPETLPPAAAALVLTATQPPRRSGALIATGRVEGGAAVFGGGIVHYAGYVHAVTPFLTRAVEVTDAAVLDLAETALDTAIALP